MGCQCSPESAYRFMRRILQPLLALFSPSHKDCVAFFLRESFEKKSKIVHARKFPKAVSKEAFQIKFRSQNRANRFWANCPTQRCGPSDRLNSLFEILCANEDCARVFNRKFPNSLGHSASLFSAAPGIPPRVSKSPLSERSQASSSPRGSAQTGESPVAARLSAGIPCRQRSRITERAQS